MNLRRDELKRTIRSPAKLNLYLNVLGRRDDGFHALETLMVPVPLWDGLSISPTPAGAGGPGGDLELVVHRSVVGGSSQWAIPATQDNLVIRALAALRRFSGCTLGAKVELVKRIPAGAGLGGGSSDAAAALRLANDVWRLGLDRSQLVDIAAQLGSDVPFFLADGAAVCRGRGEHVERVAAVPLHFVLAKPPVDLSTAEVYRAYDALDTSGPHRERSHLDDAVKALRSGRLAQLAAAMHNGLQAAAAASTPWVEKARAAFSRLDFLAHQLSGSGSTYFGLCRHAQHARRLASALRNRDVGLVYALRSCP